MQLRLQRCELADIVLCSLQVESNDWIKITSQPMPMKSLYGVQCQFVNVASTALSAEPRHRSGVTRLDS